MINLSALSVPAVIAVFSAAAILVWVAGTRLAIHGDELAERHDLAKDFVGLIFLAFVTELPEIVTTVTGAGVENAPLVLGNLFGGITLNTAILAMADFFIVRQALTSWPRKPTHALLAVMLIVLLSTLLAITLIGDGLPLLHVGLGSIALFCAYPLVIALLRTYDERDSWAPVDLPEEGERGTTMKREADRFPGVSSHRLILMASVYSLVILAAGVALVLSADALAAKTGLGASFIGVTLLAAATSLPELSTTFAAARIGAYTMAIANIFGSNLIMLALILPADLFYRPGPILSEADGAAQFSLATGILVTAIYVAGILIRRTPSILGAGLDSWLVMIAYIGSLVGLYLLQ